MSFPIRENSPRTKCNVALPWNVLHFREREKVTETFRQSLSHLIICRRLDFGQGDCQGRPQDAENGLPVVYICWCTLSGLKKTRPLWFLLLENVVLDWFVVSSCLFGVVVHLPKFDSRCEEPSGNYKIKGAVETGVKRGLKKAHKP